MYIYRERGRETDRRRYEGQGNYTPRYTYIHIFRKTERQRQMHD